MGSGYCTRDSSQDTRHPVQVVHAAGVVGLGVFGQEWLYEEKMEHINRLSCKIASVMILRFYPAVAMAMRALRKPSFFLQKFSRRLLTRDIQFSLDNDT